MWGFNKRTSDRRRKVQRDRAGSSKSLWGRFQERVGIWPATVTLGFFLAVTAIALYGDGHSINLGVGQTLDRPIYARVSFTRLDDEQTQRAREAAKAATPSVYRLNTGLIARLGGDLQALYQAAKGAESLEALAPVAKEQGWPIDKAAFEALRGFADEGGGLRFAKCIDALKNRLREEYTVRPTVKEDRQPPSNASVVRVSVPVPGKDQTPPGDTPRTEVAEIKTVQLIPISSPRIVEAQAMDLAARTFPPSLQRLVAAVVTRQMAEEPLLLFDKAATKAAMDEAYGAVPDTVIDYKRGDLLIPHYTGDARTVLDRKDLALLQLENRAYQQVLSGRSDAAEGARLRTERFHARLGVATVLALLSFALFAYVHQYQPRVLRVRARTLAFALLLLGVLAASKAVVMRFEYRELVIGPTLFAAAILIIAYPQRFVSGVGALLALLVVLVTRGDVGTLVLLSAGTTVVTLTLVNIRSRTQITLSGLLTALVVAVVCLAFGLMERQELNFILRGALVGAATALMAALVIQATLPFIERAFRIATPLTLQEWGDATRPLLQRLAHEAPGTYNHSLVVGTMANAACEAIGANGLLARVGALYHDIGKIPKRDYFAENQEASINRHDNLSPTMSLLIIVGHVKDGIEMAKEYGLSRVLYQFIEEHHGTTVVRYFHHAASEKQPHIASGKHDREVPETEFRYPGPKPHSKESAILMLCDGVEGAVRALAEPTAGRIESVVHAVLTDRLNDGQFDDCEIMLRELHRVEESLVKSLCRFYHGRVVYPKVAKDAG